MSDDATDSPPNLNADATTDSATGAATSATSDSSADASPEPASGGATPPASKGVGKPVLIAAFLTLIALYVGFLKLLEMSIEPV